MLSRCHFYPLGRIGLSQLALGVLILTMGAGHVLNGPPACAESSLHSVVPPLPATANHGVGSSVPSTHDLTSPADATSMPAVTDIVPYPPRLETTVSQPVNTQVQTAINPDKRVHTQVRLEFLQGLFAGNAAEGQLPQGGEDALSQLENQLYGKTYIDQRLGKRLGRVENSLWPKESADKMEQRSAVPVQQRWAAIQAEMAEKSVVPTQPALRQQTEDNLRLTLAYMEQRLYQIASPEATPLEQRINRIETTLYGQPAADNTPVAQRVASLAERFPLAPTGIQLNPEVGAQMTIAPITREESSTSPPLSQPAAAVSVPATSAVKPHQPSLQPAASPSEWVISSKGQLVPVAEFERQQKKATPDPSEPSLKEMELIAVPYMGGESLSERVRRNAMQTATGKLRHLNQSQPIVPVSNSDTFPQVKPAGGTVGFPPLPTAMPFVGAY